MIYLDHIDIVTSHNCNNNCKYCIDKFLYSSSKEISLDKIEWFLSELRHYTKDKLEVLLLGGEPTMLSEEKLIDIANIIREYDFIPIMSSNGLQREKIIHILPYYEWVQVTVYNDKQIEFWRRYKDKINIKLSGDKTLTIDKLNHFIESTTDYKRRSVSMYFTEDYKELCTDKEVWKLLNSKEHKWERNGSYMYMFYKGVRFKKSIHNETNRIDEPTVPKLYPNGNYNKTWLHEEMDNYLNLKVER